MKRTSKLNFEKAGNEGTIQGLFTLDEKLKEGIKDCTNSEVFYFLDYAKGSLKGKACKKIISFINDISIRVYI